MSYICSLMCPETDWNILVGKLSYVIVKNWFMLSVRISSYGCTRDVLESTKEA